MASNTDLNFIRGALKSALAECLARGETPEFRALAWTVMARVFCALAAQSGRSPHGGRLLDGTKHAGTASGPAQCHSPPLLLPAQLTPTEPPERLGEFYQCVLSHQLDSSSGEARVGRGHGRKLSGSFYTPPSITESVVRAAFEALPAERRGAERGVCDPAMGAGAFLVESVRQLVGGGAAAVTALSRVCGVDRDPLAVAVAEAALWLLSDGSQPVSSCGAQLFEGDALTGAPYPAGELGRSAPGGGFDWLAAFPDLQQRGFDLVVGNPPWLAFAGRAAQPLTAQTREFYKRRFAAWRGYPTLHALFVERAAELGHSGALALLVPSPLADLDGYRAVRRVLRERHRPCEPLIEFGQDAFSLVTQPCFALVAAPGSSAGDAAPFRLTERARAASAAAEVAAPEVLSRVRHLPSFPDELFGEMGFQSTAAVSQQLFLRADAPDAEHDYPLLEGRDVREFYQGAPRLFICGERERVRALGARLRPREDYRRVRFVVRQTAIVPIAALHGGLPFRNSLLAGFDVPGFSPELMVGLLNSALYRALHLALRRDARQAAFPQLKIGHLRSMPAPPSSGGVARIEACVRTASRTRGIDDALRWELDESVFDSFDVSAGERDDVFAFLRSRVAKLRHGERGGGGVVKTA